MAIVSQKIACSPWKGATAGSVLMRPVVHFEWHLKCTYCWIGSELASMEGVKCHLHLLSGPPPPPLHFDKISTLQSGRQWLAYLVFASVVTGSLPADRRQWFLQGGEDTAGAYLHMEGWGGWGINPPHRWASLVRHPPSSLNWGLTPSRRKTCLHGQQFVDGQNFREFAPFPPTTSTSGWYVDVK